MPTNALRFTIFKTLFTELYKKCGFLVISSNNTYLTIDKLPNGKVKVLGKEFHIALSSHPFTLEKRLILLCDICLSNPTKEFIESFAQKLQFVKCSTDLELEGIVAFTNPLNAELARYAKSLGVHALTYHDSPILSPFLPEIDLLCGSYALQGITEEAIYDFGEAFAGFLQRYYALQAFQAKPLFKNGFQIMFINILNMLQSIDFTLFGFTSGGYLLHLFGTEDAKLMLENGNEVICTIKSKTKRGRHFKALYLQNGSCGFSLTLPHGIAKCTLFKGEHKITLVTSALKTNSLKIE